MEGLERVKEGAAEVVFESGNVFYNEVQIKNRDLSTLVLNEYSIQLRREGHEQIRRHEAKEPWRKLPPTWDTWGDELTQTDDQVDMDGMRVLEALSASGLRSVRYIKEVTEGVGIEHILVNDLEPHAVEAINRNLAHNGLTADPRIEGNVGDANEVMFNHRFDALDHCFMTKVKSLKPQKELSTNVPFDIIDLDPYGSPSIFIDGALQSIRDGGLLCVTATDLSALCGKNQEVCFARYGAFPLQSIGKYPHEMAIRILLGSIDGTAAKYGKFIVPILSVHFDFYIRVFIRVYSNKNEVKAVSAKSGLVMQSRGCDSFYIQPRGFIKPSPKNVTNMSLKIAGLQVPSECVETGADLAIGGPIWIYPIHNMPFVNNLLGHFKKPCAKGFDASKLGANALVEGKLAAIADELVAVPLFYSLPSMCKKLHCTMPKMADFQSAIINAGYQVSATQSDPNGVKTDATPAILWDILRCWVKKHPVVPQPGSVAEKILSVEPELKADFSWPKEIRNKHYAKKNATEKVISKFAKNPKPNWGPKPAASGSSGRQTHKRNNKRNNDDDISHPTSSKRIHTESAETPLESAKKE